MKYGLIGEKLGHSFSEEIHGKIADYTYELKEVPREELHSFMKNKDFKGINVTIPYKSAVLPYLYYIDDTAKDIGAVNTIVNLDGKLYGYNTDLRGMKLLIEKCGFDYQGQKVLIAGTGGTAKTARAVAESLGAKTVVNVSRKKDDSENYTDYENVYNLHSDADYIINTTPLGMYPDSDSFAFELSRFRNLKGVTDVVYNPLRTRLCQEADKIGVKNESGLYMLVAQAVLASELFKGEAVDVKKITDETFSEIMREKQNIVLVGMPGCGKTTVGKILSQELGKSFTDTDEIIEEKYGSIVEIFKVFGEEYFRDRESEAIKTVAYQTKTVIATGGGAILRSENIQRLRQNGKVFFLDRPLDNLLPTDDRPLSNSRETLEKLFNERYETYKASADVTICVDGDAEDTARKIMEMI